MKFITVSLALLFITILYSNSFRIDNNQNQFPVSLMYTDTSKPFRVIDLINQISFRGIIILDNKVIDINDTFNHAVHDKGKIKEVKILNKVPLDSVLKYGNEAKYGMLIMKTK